MVFCARTLHQAEREEGRIELDLQPPQIDGLSDLNLISPDGDGHRWTTPLNVACAHSLLSVFIRQAHRVWEDHRRSLGLPAIVLDAAQPEESALNDVAKAAIALDVPLELDEDGAPSASELATALSGLASSRVLSLQLRQALPESTYSLACETSVDDSAVVDARSLSAQAESSEDNETNAGDLVSTTAFNNAIDRLTPQAPWCCPTLHQADLVNQHVLCQLLNEGKDRPTVRQKEKAQLGHRGAASTIDWALFTPSQDQKLSDVLRERTVQRLNARRRQVHELKRDVVAMAKARSAEPMIDQVQTGIISGVQSYGFFVEIPPSMVEGLVHVSSLNDDWYEYRSRQNRLVGRRSRRVYQLGDSVDVKVLKVDVLRNQIDLEVVPSETPAAAEPLPVSVSEE